MEASKKNAYFVGLCPKLWVGGGQESLTFGFPCIYRILGHFQHNFSPESPKCARWVGGIRYLGQSPKMKGFF